MQTGGLYKENTVLHGILYKTHCSHIVTYINPSSGDEQGKKTRIFFDVRRNWISLTRKGNEYLQCPAGRFLLNYPPTLAELVHDELLDHLEKKVRRQVAKAAVSFTLFVFIKRFSSDSTERNEYLKTFLDDSARPALYALKPKWLTFLDFTADVTSSSRSPFVNRQNPL